jgi:DNA-binding IclR family transcriptional regulator
LSDSELSRCIETQKRIGNPVCGKEELRAVVKRARSNGYYISHSELDDAINALGLPIFGKNGVVLGSLSIVAPSSRMSDEVTWELLPEARRSAQRISERMGYDGNMLNSKGE